MRKIEDKPFVSNYPPLDAWLKRHQARCMWQLPLGGTKREPQAYVEQWLFPNGRLCVLIVCAKRTGWWLFTDTPGNEIEPALRDAEARLGLP